MSATIIFWGVAIAQVMLALAKFLMRGEVIE
jgi:hypothetical protein